MHQIGKLQGFFHAEDLDSVFFFETVIHWLQNKKQKSLDMMLNVYFVMMCAILLVSDELFLMQYLIWLILGFRSFVSANVTW